MTKQISQDSSEKKIETCSLLECLVSCSMTLLARVSGVIRPAYATAIRNGSASLNIHGAGQIRTATKKVSGSKTNKNDSAGRRLGPKANEGQLVCPGTIIMRQRGTVIHPGPNVRIGVDHTIYAVEPGYVRFYLDPFHPLRKYVGIALKADEVLPSPHFAPRSRRFGYELIENKEDQEREQSRMSRKEFLAQPEIEAAKEARAAEEESVVKNYAGQLASEFSVPAEMIADASQRYYQISRFIANGMSNEHAKAQATCSQMLVLRLQHARAKISDQEYADSKQKYTDMTNLLDETVSVGAHGKLYSYVPVAELMKRRTNTLEALRNNYLRLLSPTERETVSAQIMTPGLFDVSEQKRLMDKYVPEKLPASVEGSVILDIDPENVPEGTILQRIFDKSSGKIKLVGRPAAVSQRD